MKYLTCLFLILCTFCSMNVSWASDQPPCNDESLDQAREAANNSKAKDSPKAKDSKSKDKHHH